MKEQVGVYNACIQQTKCGRKYTVKWKYSFIHICMISLICLLVCQMPLKATTIDIPPTASKAIVFLLDASNSMNSN